MNLGEKIYQLRNDKNLSQGDLAEKLNVSRQSISKWETNASVPELDKLVRMHTIFDISLDELSLEEYQAISPVFQEDIYEAITMKTCVEKRLTIGAPGIEAMKKVIDISEQYLIAEADK